MEGYFRYADIKYVLVNLLIAKCLEHLNQETLDNNNFEYFGIESEYLLHTPSDVVSQLLKYLKSLQVTSLLNLSICRLKTQSLHQYHYCSLETNEKIVTASTLVSDININNIDLVDANPLLLCNIALSIHDCMYGRIRRAEILEQMGWFELASQDIEVAISLLSNRLSDGLWDAVDRMYFKDGRISSLFSQQYILGTELPFISLLDVDSDSLILSHISRLRLFLSKKLERLIFLKGTYG